VDGVDSGRGEGFVIVARIGGACGSEVTAIGVGIRIGAEAAVEVEGSVGAEVEVRVGFNIGVEISAAGAMCCV
jgi:hypothetical protein